MAFDMPHDEPEDREEYEAWEREQDARYIEYWERLEHRCDEREYE